MQSGSVLRDPGVVERLELREIEVVHPGLEAREIFCSF